MVRFFTVRRIPVPCRSPAVFVLAFVLVFAGCGFQPRGDLALPGAIEVRGGSFELRDALNARLAGRGARIAAKAADVVLDVGTASFTERMLTVEPLRGNVREYRVEYRVRYTVKNGSGEQLLEPGEVRLEREYRLHSDERDSRTREKARIHRELRRAAAAAILRRLHALFGG